MPKSGININIKISTKTAAWCLALGLVGLFSFEAISETLTLTTYYPAPVGVYKRMSTTSDTKLARFEGNVLLAEWGGSVGIGTDSPSATLDVSNGDLNVDKQIRADTLAVSEGISAKRVDITEDLTARSIQIGTGAACASTNDAGKLSYIDGAIKFCDGGGEGWKPIAEETTPAEGQCITGTNLELSGENVSCPEGAYATDKNTSPKTCSWKGFSGTVKCTTSSGWGSTGTCQRNVLYCSGPWKARRCHYRKQKCSSGSWTAIRCRCK